MPITRGVRAALIHDSVIVLPIDHPAIVVAHSAARMSGQPFSLTANAAGMTVVAFFPINREE